MLTIEYADRMLSTINDEDLKSGITVIDDFVNNVQEAAEELSKSAPDLKQWKKHRVQISITNFQNTKPDNLWLNNMAKRCPHIEPVDMSSEGKGEFEIPVLRVRLPKAIWDSKQMLKDDNHYILDTDYDPEKETLWSLKCK